MEMDIYQIHLIPIDAPFSFLLNAPSSASEITLHAELFSEAPSPCRGQRCRVGFLPPWFIILNPIHIRFGPDAAARFGVEVRGRCSSMGASSRRRSQGARRSSRRWAAAAMLEQLVPLLISRCSAVPQLPRADFCRGEEGVAQGRRISGERTANESVLTTLHFWVAWEARSRMGCPVGYSVGDHFSCHNNASDSILGFSITPLRQPKNAVP
jgi:hypothetical protein